MRVPLVLLALAIPAVGAAQTTGTVSGTITSSTSSTPLMASVALFGAADTKTIAVSGGTDSAGRYSLATVAPGTYFLRASSTGFVTQVHAGVTCIAADCAVASGTPIVVTAGATLTVDVALVPGGSITGVVRRAADGTPVSSTYVFVHVYNAAGSLVGSGIPLGVDGSYRMDGLAAGTYFASTSPAGFSPPKDYLDELYGGTVCPVPPFVPQVSPCPVVRGAPITVTAGATTGGIDFLLDAGGRISGTVTGVGESVPSGTAVKAYSGSVLIASGFTDASGGYTITGLPSGLYTVRTDTGVSGSSSTPPSNLVDEWYPNLCVGCEGTPAGVAVTAGATTPLDFELATGGRIGGTFALAPAPPGAFLGFPDIQVFSSTGTLVRTGRLIGANTWQAAGLAAGTYYAKTANPVRVASRPSGPTFGWWIDEVYDNIPCVADDCSPNRGTPLALTAGGQVTGVNIALDLGAAISGGDPLLCSPCTGRPELYDARGVRLSDRIGDSLFSTYRALGLPTGTYYLKMPRNLQGRYPETLHKDITCDGCAVTSGTPISLTAGQPDVLITFSSLPSQAIRGTVRSSGGAPLSTITVEIFSPNGAALGTATTTADGRYVVAGLNPGVYFARTTNQQGFVDVLYGNQACPGCDPLGGDVIVVAAGADTTGIDFSLTAGTAVSGTLTTSLAPVVVIGPPTVGVISGGVLRFVRQDGILAARAVTDSLGRFETTLAPGSYEARLEPLAGYADASRTVTVGSTAVTNADVFVFPAGVLTISPVRLASAAVGVSYRQTLVVSGGSGTNAFAIGAGTLPPGLTLDPISGVIAGTPSGSGRFTFTVIAHSLARYGAREYTLDVPACPFALVNSGFISRASGEPFQVQVTNTCGTWTAATTDSWIHLQTPGPNPATVVGATQAYTGTVPRVGHVTIGPRVFTVTQNGTVTGPPFGVVDTPVNGAAVSGSVSVSGWALDDLAVNRVEIFRDSVAGEPAGQVFLGTATFVPGARPDVQAAYPTAPRNNVAGWGYLLLTNMLPSQGNGTFKLYAYAIDSDAMRALLGARTIVAANSTSTSPFGAIDTPAQGGTIAGSSYVNWGWALTPQPKLIPLDGSTIDVVIDGVPVGKVTSYNLFRSDVSGLFPGLKNSGGPVGYRAIDTTALSEGLHTIAWVAADDGGQATGIGSRYFTVQNSAWLPSLKSGVRLPPAFTPSEIALADRTTAVPARIDGIDVGRRAASLASLPIDDEGARSVELGQLQSLELALSKVSDDAACVPAYEGYLSANGELRALPIGSSLDPKGTFYWQPGPGFFGRYQFVFVRTGCGGERSRITVSVRIR